MYFGSSLTPLVLILFSDLKNL